MISLSARVGWSAGLTLALFMALTALALERAFEESARAAVRERLFAQIYLVMAAAEVSADGTLRMPANLAEPRLGLPASGLYARIDDPQGRRLWQSASAVGVEPPAPPSADSERYLRVSAAGEEYFVASLAVEWEADGRAVPLVFSVSEDLRPYDEQIGRYRGALWGWLAATAVVSLVALAGSLAWGLRPLRTVAAELRAVESGAQERLLRNYPRELRALTDNVNALLKHEHTQQARYRNALADLAHSLKTPLAVLRGMGAGQGGGEYDEQLQRMDAIVQYQLQRAATAGRSALAAAIPLLPTVQRLTASLDKVHRDKRVSVVCEVAADARFRGDEGDLMELLGNLLDNAYKWCASQVRVTATGEGAVVHLSVEDDGPGIDPANAEAVLRRGVRADEATPGHGIGLPMVRDIVEAYGGELRIDRSDMGGAVVRVTLPAR